MKRYGRDLPLGFNGLAFRAVEFVDFLITDRYMNYKLDTGNRYLLYIVFFKRTLKSADHTHRYY